MLDETLGQFAELYAQSTLELGWPFDRSPHDQRCDRIQVVREGSKAKSHGLEWYAAATSSRIQYGMIAALSAQRIYDVFAVRGIRNVAECPSVAICLALETSPSPASRVDSPARGDRVTVYSDGMQESLSVGILRKEGGKHCRSRGNQWPPRPPDVQIVRRWQRGHRASFPHTFFTESCNWQPSLDQASVLHFSISWLSDCRQKTLA